LLFPVVVVLRPSALFWDDPFQAGVCPSTLAFAAINPPVIDAILPHTVESNQRVFQCQRPTTAFRASRPPGTSARGKALPLRKTIEQE
jgi:hypothetical protein